MSAVSQRSSRPRSRDLPPRPAGSRGTTPGFATCAFPSPESSATGLASQSHRPAGDLWVSASVPVGLRYYRRVRSCDGAACGAWSAVLYLDVGRVPGDVNGDGYADLVVGAYFQDAGAGAEGNASA